jgi:hypothetical protein
MAKLNGDIYFYIFQNLRDIIHTDINNEINYKKSLHSCLLVNKLCCEIIIPILWSDPYKYFYKKNLLFNIIISHLSDDSIKLLKDKSDITEDFQKQKLSFNYIRFCKYLNNIERIFPNDSWSLKVEIYKLFISECSSIKCLSSEMLSHSSIYEYPGANTSLSNLYELDYDYSKRNYFRELGQICRSIEKIHVKIYKDNKDYNEFAELIEMQKQIKYIVYRVEYNECKRIDQALEKHANSIICLDLIMHNHAILHSLFPKLINLQFLRINYQSYKERNFKDFKEYIINPGYCNLQVLELQFISPHVVINIIQNTNGNLYKIKVRFATCDQEKEYNQSIYKYCPNIKYVTAFLNKDGTLEELENIIIKCQQLVAIDINDGILKKYFDKFLDLLVNSASLTLYKIHLEISPTTKCLEILKSFIINWNCKGRKTLHFYNYIIFWNEFIEDIKSEGYKIQEYEYNYDDFWNIIDFHH